MTWSPYKSGSSLGQRGSENGVILRDEEHAEGSRITLERDGSTAPFAITCGIYDWMVHARFFSTEEAAGSEYERMKVDRAEILSVIPYNDDPEKEEKMDRAIGLINDFVERPFKDSEVESDRRTTRSE